MRLKSDFFVAALLRRCNGNGLTAVLGKRGAAEAGAIFIQVDTLDGRVCLYGPAPQSSTDLDGVERRFLAMHTSEFIDAAKARAIMLQQMRFDPDLWLVEMEDRSALRHRDFLDVVTR